MGIRGENMRTMVNSNQLELDDGEITLFGFNMLMLPVSTVTSLIEGIYDRCGEEETFEVLFETGRAHGQKAIDEIGKEHDIPKKQFIDQAMYTGDVLGMGKLSYERLNFDKGEVIFRVEGSPLKEAFEKSDKLSELDRPIDDFHLGVFHRIAEELLDAPIESEETHCNFQGDPYCRFVIRTK